MPKALSRNQLNKNADGIEKNERNSKVLSSINKPYNPTLKKLFSSTGEIRKTPSLRASNLSSSNIARAFARSKNPLNIVHKPISLHWNETDPIMYIDNIDSKEQRCCSSISRDIKKLIISKIYVPVCVGTWYCVGVKHLYVSDIGYVFDHKCFIIKKFIQKLQIYGKPYYIYYKFIVSHIKMVTIVLKLKFNKYGYIG